MSAGACILGCAGPELLDAEGSPEAYVEDLRHERDTIESKLDSVESELDDLRVEYAGFLLAAISDSANEGQFARARRGGTERGRGRGAPP